MRYNTIRSLDISNGSGVGIAAFLQGCPFNPHCENCFNPETWDFNGGKEWTKDVEDKFIELASRPYIRRVSLLGGEPLAGQNLDGVLNLVNKIRLSLPNKTIWLYTGYDFDSIKHSFEESKKMLQAPWKESSIKRWKIISQCDVLVDGRYIDSQRNPSLKWKGSENQRVIDIPESLKQGKVILYST